jgi:3-hydroxyisobutyrate dehydrogenase-like beta-hydroxyacid dehydrogenase
MNIAFLGIGFMGRPMAIRLVHDGHDVTVWNRTAEKAEPVIQKGASGASSPAEAVATAEVVVTMLADEPALDQVLFGPRGAVESLRAGHTLVEMSTIGPDAVRRIKDRLPRDVGMIDAPVLGTVPQATDGSLKVFVGGTEEAFERVRPVLEVFGEPRRFGGPGAGAAMKLVVNATLPTIMSALGESLALADGLGLSEDAVLDVLADSAIGVTVRSKRPLIESGEYRPNFKLHLALKDAVLVQEAAEGSGRTAPVARAAQNWLRAADEAGLGELDYSAVIPHIRGRQAR